MDWSDEFCIGVEKIDEQHKRLFARVTKVQLSLTSSADTQKEIGKALRFLVDYTQEHFQDEEALMEEINYADMEHHKKLHARMIQKLVEILLDLKKGKAIRVYDFVDYLIDWLSEHIKIEDKRIGKAYNVYKILQETKTD